MSDGLTAISFPESNSRMARFALRQLPVFWWQEAGVSLRVWLMKNSVKIVKLFLSPSSTPNQSLTETMKTQKKICLFMHNKKLLLFFTFLAIFSSGTIAAYAPAVTRTLAARDWGEEGIGRINGSSMD